jgi:quercetin dioxygenase-like cupin family protein
MSQDECTPLDLLYAALGEAMAPAAPPQELAMRLRQRLLTSLSPPPSARLITIPAAAGVWQKLAPGVAIKVLREDEQSRSLLLRMAPAAELPAHDHDLEEECLVLEGEVRLGDLRLRAGDYHLALRGIPHGVVRSEPGCLLFIRGQRQYRSGG